MKTKKVALFGLAAASCLALASCGPKDNAKREEWDAKLDDGHTYVNAPADENYESNGGRVDINVNYSGESGITYTSAQSYRNLVDGRTYTKGALLPVWRAIEEKTKTSIKEASSYTTDNSSNTYAKVESSNFASEKDSKQKIDLIMLADKEIQAMGSAGKAVNLMKHLDKMPNFAKWLEKYPSQARALIKGYGTDEETLYYTPYYEGQNNLERMFVMDTQLVEFVLDDANAAYDTEKTNGGNNPDKNVVKAGAYQPFMDATNNYKDATTLKVIDEDNKVVNVAVKQVKNIVAQQNELLANGCTGKQLADQFNKYLKDAYGEYMGAGKLYEKPSEIFVSKKACYNVDELIALMRVIKANPKLISGDANKEIVTFFVRGQADNRVNTINQMAQLWGVQGVSSAQQKLYFDANGKLHDAQTTIGTYEALEYISQMYEEGLIQQEFWAKPASPNNAIYLNKYYYKNNAESGYGFMCWDFGAATAATNDKYEGIGTDPATRKIQYSSKGIRPVLPPYTYWATEKNWDHNQHLNDMTGKTITRYIEANTALKTGSWVIPSTTDNLDGALRIMDYMFSNMGNYIQSFGPEEYWAHPTGTPEGKAVVANDLFGSSSNEDWENLSPIMSPTTKKMFSESGKGFYNFMRENIGATHGIGHIRSKGCDLQATNAYGQVGISNLQLAIGAGVVVKNETDPAGVKGFTWYTTVPKIGSSTDIENVYGAITAFWAKACNDPAYGWVRVVNTAGGSSKLGSEQISQEDYGKYSYAQSVNAQIFSVKDKKFLFDYANAIKSATGNDCIPDYAKS